MYHWNEMYWETYLSDQTNTQTVMTRSRFLPTWDRYNIKKWPKCQTGQTSNDENDTIQLLPLLLRDQPKLLNFPLDAKLPLQLLLDSFNDTLMNNMWILNL